MRQALQALAAGKREDISRKEKNFMNDRMGDEERAEVRPYTYKELTLLYGISRRTLNTWLTEYKYEIGPKRGRYFNIAQVEIIFRWCGRPWVRL
ncbi:MAG TPA: hypothetical protein VL093_04920 [Flavipsychrobacter sp.]|nr:hypothetical protein [Flavipsychrobacter sp.]